MQRLLSRRRFANALNGIALAGIELGLRVLIYTPKPLFRAGGAIFDRVALWAYLGWLRYKVNDPEVRQQLRPRFGQDAPAARWVPITYPPLTGRM